jgi:hypothetical protein
METRGGEMRAPERAGVSPERAVAERILADRSGMAAPERSGTVERLERPDRPVRDRSALRQAATADAGAGAVAEAPPRSKAERDLLQALRAKR